MLVHTQTGLRMKDFILHNTAGMTDARYNQQACFLEATVDEVGSREGGFWECRCRLHYGGQVSPRIAESLTVAAAADTETMPPVAC